MHLRCDLFLFFFKGKNIVQQWYMNDFVSVTQVKYLIENAWKANSLEISFTYGHHMLYNRMPENV
jgi:hypothetical protein